MEYSARAKLVTSEAVKALQHRGFDVTAKELLRWYRHKYQNEPEKFSSRAGTVYMFGVNIVKQFSDADWALIKRLRTEPVHVFRVGFLRGARNQKGYRIPIAQLLVRKGQLHQGDQVISMEDYERLREFSGAILSPGETYTEFRARALSFTRPSP